MASGIILAGGYSSRAKQNKMVMEFHGKSLICHAIEAMQDYCSKVIVVTGHYHDDIVNVVSSYEKVEVIRNLDYKLGMFSSVKVGVRVVDDDFFLTPGDYPLINKSTYQAVLKANGRIRVPVFNNKRGHPLYISKELINDLLNENNASNLKQFRNKFEIVNVETKDEGILIDIDTLNDYLNLKTKRKEE